jgi:hypothetical protein
MRDFSRLCQASPSRQDGSGGLPMSLQDDGFDAAN